MRRRILLGTVVGTVVAFVYGFLTWAALDLWSGKVQSLPPQHPLLAVEANQVLVDGAYFFPPLEKGRVDQLRSTGRPEDAAQADALEAAWTEAHRRGPTGMLIIRKQGSEPMSAGVFACSIGFDVLCAGLMSFFLAATACPSWPGRWMYGLMIGAFAALAANGADASWFHYPANFVLYDAADIFLKWTTVSAAVALVVAPTTQCPFHRAPPAAA